LLGLGVWTVVVVRLGEGVCVLGFGDLIVLLVVVVVVVEVVVDVVDVVDVVVLVVPARRQLASRGGRSSCYIKCFPL
jgi:hypothetical protein